MDLGQRPVSCLTSRPERRLPAGCVWPARARLSAGRSSSQDTRQLLSRGRGPTSHRPGPRPVRLGPHHWTAEPPRGQCPALGLTAVPRACTCPQDARPLKLFGARNTLPVPLRWEACPLRPRGLFSPDPSCPTWRDTCSGQWSRKAPVGRGETLALQRWEGTRPEGGRGQDGGGLGRPGRGVWRRGSGWHR